MPKKEGGSSTTASHRAIPTPSQTIGQGDDISKLMEAITNSEKKVLARIDTMDKKVDSKYQELHKIIDSLSADLKGNISAVRDEVLAEINTVQSACAAHEAQLTSLEEANNEYSDRVVDVEAQLAKLNDEVSKLSQKVEDLEGRQRRDNIRILGVKETFQLGPRPTQTVAKLLQDCLKLDAVPTLDRAHRSLQPEPGKGNTRPRPKPQWPRTIIVKFHYHQEQQEVLQKAAATTSLEFDGQKIMIFPDLPQAVVKRRAAFKDTKELLRPHHPRVRFGMVYPAKLRITSPLGEEIFACPNAAMDYTLANFSQIPQNEAVE